MPIKPHPHRKKWHWRAFLGMICCKRVAIFMYRNQNCILHLPVSRFRISLIYSTTFISYKVCRFWNKKRKTDLPGIIHFKHLFMHFTILIVSTTFLPSSLCWFHPGRPVDTGQWPQRPPPCNKRSQSACGHMQSLLPCNMAVLWTNLSASPPHHLFLCTLKKSNSCVSCCNLILCSKCQVTTCKAICMS